MELVVWFKNDSWQALVLNDEGLVRCLNFNPTLDVNDFVIARIIEKSPLKNTFFIEYQNGKTGLLIKGYGFKIGDKIKAIMLRREEAPFKSAKFAPIEKSEEDLYKIIKGENPLLNLIKQYKIDKITCNPCLEASVFKGKAILKEKPFDEIMQEEIEALKNPMVLLKNGARIILEKTAAFTAIDVDSGASSEPSEVINLIALKEILKQLELREIYGQIVIDFIGHAGHKNLDEVVNLLKNSQNVVKFISLTKLNLIELIRER